MFVFVRVIVYATLFIGFVFVYLPSRLLASSGLVRPEAMGARQVMGMIIGVAGSLVALWCVFTFASVGKGTPAPFDPPRRLVVRGPYRFVRNPMYLGAAMALLGAALFYQSLILASYCAFFLLVIHFFLISYEEPALRKNFGDEYETYCNRVRRWIPGLAHS